MTEFVPLPISIAPPALIPTVTPIALGSIISAVRRGVQNVIVKNHLFWEREQQIIFKNMYNLHINPSICDHPLYQGLDMARLNNTRNILEDFVREGSFKWLVGNRSSFDEEVEDIGQKTSRDKSWLPELSFVANVVVRRCSRRLG